MNPEIACTHLNDVSGDLASGHDVIDGAGNHYTGIIPGWQAPLAMDVPLRGEEFELVFPTCFMANSTVLGLTSGLSAHA
jgi:hypothetical protein